MRRFIVILIVTFSLSGLFALYAQQTNLVTTHHSAVKEQNDTSKITVIAMNNRIKVLNAPLRSKLEIYSVVGIKVDEIEIKQTDGEYVLNIAKGYYIVRIGETVCKIAIR